MKRRCWVMTLNDLENRFKVRLNRLRHSEAKM